MGVVVFNEKEGTNQIKGLVLDLNRLAKSSYTCTQDLMNVYSSHSFPLSRSIDLQIKSFKKMHKLQILQLHDVNIEGDFENFPKNLVMLCWNGFPLRCIPSNFHLKKLVSLDLSYSDIKTTWDDGTMDCSRLHKLPKNFNMLESLEEIDFSGCSNLEELPRELGKFKSLKHHRPSYAQEPCARPVRRNPITSKAIPVNLEYLRACECSSLERIESPQVISRQSRLYVMVIDCDKLVEIQSFFKIYPIDRIDKGIAKSLGLSNLESLANIKVDMLNELTHSIKTSSVEVLDETGVDNIFLPGGDDIPNCFSIQSVGNEISFQILQVAGRKICAMNICISYTVSHGILNDVIYGHYLKEFHDVVDDDVYDCYDYQEYLPHYLPGSPGTSLCIGIDNWSLGRRWSYSPTCYVIPKSGENIQWLSHWKLGDGLQMTWLTSSQDIPSEQGQGQVLTPLDYHYKIREPSIVFGPIAIGVMLVREMDESDESDNSSSLTGPEMHN
ncbi:hypothetical protein ACFE04_013174 [Oxalis oulophora]